jgi:hypothetical protein
MFLSPGITLTLHGMVTNLIVEGTGVALIYGMVNENIRNRGSVRLYGMVLGDIDSTDGHFWADPIAVVKGSVELPGFRGRLVIRDHAA